MDNQNTQPPSAYDETTTMVLEYFDTLQQISELLEDWVEND